LAKRIGRHVRRHRLARRWTREVLACILRIPDDLLTQYETGELSPPIHTLYQLAGAFEVEAGAFITGCVRPEYRSPELEVVFSQLESLRAPDREALLGLLATALSALEKLRGKTPASNGLSFVSGEETGESYPQGS